MKILNFSSNNFGATENHLIPGASDEESSSQLPLLTDPTLLNPKKENGTTAKGKAKVTQTKKNIAANKRANNSSNQQNVLESTTVRGRKASILQNGDSIQFIDKDRENKTSHTTPNQSKPSTGLSSAAHTGAHHGNFQERSSVLSFPDSSHNMYLNKTVPTTKKPSKSPKKPKQQDPFEGNVIYDPDAFSQVCSSDYLRPNTLLDLYRKVQDRDERLVNLADQCCVAKGKVKQLTFIRDGLNRELVKQAVLLLAITDGIASHTNANHNNAVLVSDALTNLIQYFSISNISQKMHLERIEKENHVTKLKKDINRLLSQQGDLKC